MKDVAELLREADPLRDEPFASLEQRELQRRVVLAAVSAGRVHPEPRARMSFFVAAALALVVVSLLGIRIWSPLTSDVQAAMRFEVRLAEEKPGPSLRAAKVAGSNRSIYLHDEVVVGNGDISTAEVVQGSEPSQYAVSVEFNAVGARKMQAATSGNVGKLMAILLDGQVVMAPVIRSPVGPSAMITGDLAKAQAERIVNGITPRR